MSENSTVHSLGILLGLTSLSIMRDMGNVRWHPAASSVQENLPFFNVDGTGLSKQHLCVALTAQDPADRRGDVARRQGSGGYLIQERLKKVMVLAVSQGYANQSGAQAARRFQPTEAAADDYYVRMCHHARMLSNPPPARQGGKLYRISECIA